MLTEITKLIMANLPYIFLGLIIMLALILIVFIRITSNLSKMNKNYEILIKGAKGGNIEHALIQNIKDVHQIRGELFMLGERIAKLEAFEKIAIKKVGVVKFDAFDDVYGQVSFALAVLNDQNNGFVLSNIYGRYESRIYLKSISNGKTAANNLTEEEKEAIAQAALLKQEG
ncbi:MAG: DUF4446 family protein [Sporomusaceae bacterium]|jgi:hypothetical protein|nr:DUF4446 family protein [Sporomusaceae bacterium]